VERRAGVVVLINNMGVVTWKADCGSDRVPGEAIPRAALLRGKRNSLEVINLMAKVL
jgi:hypothetical protein